jgi:hypothetical protein
MPVGPTLATAMASPPVWGARERTLARAVIATLAYADVFDHPLDAAEVHRYLVATPASRDEVADVLVRWRALGRVVESGSGRYALAGRRASAALRWGREGRARRLWPKARRWGKALAALPFVRMVAVTGALAVDAADPGADIDYLVVAAAGRVWTCRAFVTALARTATLAGVRLCPNYVLSEGALGLDVRTLYTAHEFVQMVPLAGAHAWAALRAANAWVSDFLPNAGWGAEGGCGGRVGGRFARASEAVLRGRLGARLEAALARWQVARLTAKIADGALRPGEAEFGRDSYKGHFDAHGARILAAWHARLAHLEEAAG